MTPDDARHPDAERLAEYADGVLDVEARDEIERHLADCGDCRVVVMDTTAFLEHGSAAGASPPAPHVIRFRSRRWVTRVGAGLAVAAALVVAIRVAWPVWVNGGFAARSDRPELQELIAAVANEPTRPVEGRLSGGFKYAPPPSPTRGPGDREVSPDVRIAAAKLEKLANTKDTPDGRGALGAAKLLSAQLDEAVTALEAAATSNPQNARFQNDLAVAYLERWARGRQSDDLQRSLAAAERAIATEPTLVEAYFNRALALDGLHRTANAKAAWQAYLQIDPRSQWTGEARRHLEDPADSPRR